MNHDESSLIARMRSDDTDAFNSLYYRYSKDILAYLRTLVSQTGEAEEVMHDVLLSLWDNRHNLRNMTSVRPFLLTAARNRALNILRRRRLLPHIDEYAQSEGAFDVAGVNNRAEIDYPAYERHIMKLVDSLPVSQRRIVRLSRFEEKSHKEICEILNLNIQTVKNALSSGLRTMKLQLCDWERVVIGELKRGGVNIRILMGYILNRNRFRIRTIPMWKWNIKNML